MRIRVTEKEKNFEGTLIEGRVTPFGTSSHIAFKRKHIGKKVHIILVDNPQYFWVFDCKLLDYLIKEAKRISMSTGKMRFHYAVALENLKNEFFELNDLIQLIKLLRKEDKFSTEIKTIKAVYQDLN